MTTWFGILGPKSINPDVAINLGSVLRRVMPLDWQEQSALWSQ